MASTDNYKDVIRSVLNVSSESLNREVAKRCNNLKIPSRKSCLLYAYKI